MGTISEKLEYLAGTKEAISAAIVSKGGSVSAADTFRSYASKITSLPSSGGTTEGWTTMDDEDSYLYLVDNFYKPYLASSRPTYPYFFAVSGLGAYMYICAEAAPLKFTFKAPNAYDGMMYAFTSNGYTTGAKGNGYQDVFTLNGVYSGISVHNAMADNKIFFPAEFTCPQLKVSAKFGAWNSYADISWLDLVKLDTTVVHAGVSYTIQNYIVMTTGDGVTPRLYGLGNGSTFTIDNTGTITISAGFRARWTWDITALYENITSGLSLHWSDTTRVSISYASYTELINSIQLTTCDIYNTGTGQIAVAQNCTMTDLTTY